jgi:hypothetical protein
MALDTRLKPTAKVTAATAAVAAVEMTVALVEWLAAVDVPVGVELPAAILATFVAGWLAPREGESGRGEHVAR